MAIELDHLGEALRALRQAAKLTQVAVRKASGLSAAQISKWENGHQTPSLPHLARFLNAVGADLRALQDALDDAGAASRPPAGTEISVLEAFRDYEYRRLELMPELREIVRELMQPASEELEELRQRLDEMDRRQDGDDD